MSRRFLLLALILLMTGIGVFLSRFIRDRMAGQRVAGAYRTIPVRDSVNSDRAPFAAVWDHGSAELVGVARHPSTNGPWWGMDGNFGADGPFVWRGMTIPGSHAFEFVFRIRDLPAGASRIQCRFADAINTTNVAVPASAEFPEAPLQEYIAIAAAFRPGQDRANIVNHANVEWHMKPVAQNERRLVSQFSGTVPPGWQTRMIAVNAAGDALADRLSLPEGSIVFSPSLNLSDVKEFRFQVRPYQWIEFKDIALAPAK